MLEDEHLILELRRGDKRALRQIYLKYKDYLLTIAASLLHDYCAAEDVLHDVFVSFAAGAGNIELRVSLRNYLVAGIANRVRDIYRKKKHPTVALDKDCRVSSDSGDPVKSAIFGEEFHLLADELSRLPFEQRETIILHIKGGMTFRDIARMRGVSTSTVQGRYRYGIDKLRTALNGERKK
ncbi:MAG: sigma-70 family RNA polymerase sigma factor [Sedimentisphaerales bacterium]|nr:sigma-70 family RNA polymerase sigma factor [Sedimentisphaerales bacterium]